MTLKLQLFPESSKKYVSSTRIEGRAKRVCFVDLHFCNALNNSVAFITHMQWINVYIANVAYCKCDK